MTEKLLTGTLSLNTNKHIVAMTIVCAAESLIVVLCYRYFLAWWHSLTRTNDRGKLVPSSHQRSELSHTILCNFVRGNQRIRKGISIPNSLREEAVFISICASNGSLKSHRVPISTTPSFGDKVICWYTGLYIEVWVSCLSSFQR